MDYSKITRLEVLDDHRLVNEYLGLGWVVVNIYATASDTQFPGCTHQTMNYVIGWLDGEPKFPEPKYPKIGNYI